MRDQKDITVALNVKLFLLISIQSLGQRWDRWGLALSSAIYEKGCRIAARRGGIEKRTVVLRLQFYGPNGPIAVIILPYIHLLLTICTRIITFPEC